MSQSAYDDAARLLRSWLKRPSILQSQIEALSGPRSHLIELVYGCLRRMRTLDALIDHLVDRAPSRELGVYLRIGLFQLFYQDTVPLPVAVHETVESAKARCGKKGAGFLNAILRRALRERDAIEAWLAQQSLGVRTSHPDTLIDRWTRRYGATDTEALCAWNNDRPDVVLRPVKRRVSLDDFQLAATKAGIALLPHPAAPEDCFTLPRGVKVPDLPGYREGWFSVQDPSTLHAVNLLAVQPGQTVLDLCAAPGGKTIQLADALQEDDRILAVESNTARVKQLQDSLHRIQLPQVEVVTADAADAEGLAAALDGRHFDRILLDAPCTNTGVLRRRPEARWRFTEETLQGLREVQLNLLTAASQRLAPGGRLVYSTCSLEPEENESLVADWRADHPGWRLQRELHIFPPTAHTDGAYAAALEAM